MVREEDRWNTYGTWNQGIQIGTLNGKESGRENRRPYTG